MEGGGRRLREERAGTGIETRGCHGHFGDGSNSRQVVEVSSVGVRSKGIWAGVVYGVGTIGIDRPWFCLVSQRRGADNELVRWGSEKT